MEYELTYELTYSNLSEGWGEGGGGAKVTYNEFVRFCF